MASVRVVIHRAEIGRLLKGIGPYAGVRLDLERRGRAVAVQAGAGNEVEFHEGHDRARVHVAAVTPQATIAEQRDRSLTRALEAGR